MTLRQCARTVALAGALCSALPPAARAAEGEVLGHFETRVYGVLGQGKQLRQLGDLGLVDFTAAGISPDAHWSVISQLHPTVKLHLTDEGSLIATVKAETRQGYFTQTIDTINDLVTVERLYLSLSRGSVDVIAGKQAITWGSGLVLNPTDIFNQKPINDLSADPPGVWGARATWGLTDTANLHLAAATLEQPCCQATLMGRYDQTLESTDFAATVAWREAVEQLVLGFDVKGELTLGLWAEGAWVVDAREHAEERGFLLLEAGVDYTFALFEQLYVALEWIHQGDGVGGEWVGPGGRPPSYLHKSFAGRDPTEARLLGSNYGLLLIRVAFNSHWRAQWLTLMNLRDPGATNIAQLTWLPLDWLEVRFGAQGAYSKRGGEFDLRTPSSTLLPPHLRDVRLQPAVAAWLWGIAYF